MLHCSSIEPCVSHSHLAMSMEKPRRLLQQHSSGCDSVAPGSSVAESDLERFRQNLGHVCIFSKFSFFVEGLTSNLRINIDHCES